MLIGAYHWFFLKDVKSGTCSLGVSLELVLGTAFFLGFLSFVGGAVQARKGLLSGRYILDEEDEKQLDMYKSPKMDAPLFVRATWAALGFVIMHGGLLGLLIYFLAPGGLSGDWLVFGVSGYLAFAAMGWSAFSSFVSVARMRKHQKEKRTRKVGFFRYAFFQNAIAALVVNIPLGYFYGHLKFPVLAQKIAEATGSEPGITFLALAFDIGFTALIIAYFTGSTMRNKVLGELFVEVEIVYGSKPVSRKTRWHWWYSLVIAGLIFLGFFFLGIIFPGARIPVARAMTIKWSLQGLIGLSVGYFSASLSTKEMLSLGTSRHPFTRVVVTDSKQ